MDGQLGNMVTQFLILNDLITSRLKTILDYHEDFQNLNPQSTFV